MQNEHKLEALKISNEYLRANLANIFWTFVTFMGFHTGLLGITAVGYEKSPHLLALLLLIGGSIIHACVIGMIDAYTKKLKENEQTVLFYEREVGLSVLTREKSIKSKFSARKLRLIFLWSVWAGEMITGIILLCS